MIAAIRSRSGPNQVQDLVRLIHGGSLSLAGWPEQPAGLARGGAATCWLAIPDHGLLRKLRGLGPDGDDHNYCLRMDLIQACSSACRLPLDSGRESVRIGGAR